MGAWGVGGRCGVLPADGLGGGRRGRVRSRHAADLLAILAGVVLVLSIGAVGFVELVGIAQEVAARLVPRSAPWWVFVVAADGLAAVILAGPGIVVAVLIARPGLEL